MKLAEILSNETLRQQEFPVTRATVFLAHAGVCPLPRRVAEAIRRYAEASTLGDQELIVPAPQIRETRELAARLLKAAPEEIALVAPTSLGLSTVAEGLSFTPGDNILIYRDDFPSNVYPWMSMARRGVEVRFLPTPEFGCIRLDDVLAAVDSRTRLVALTSCHFVAGWRVDIQGIGRQLRERNILFCVDGIQTLGAFPTSVEHVDFLAADAHKWLLGPCAAGVFYVRREKQEMLQPTTYGWNNIRCPNYLAQENIVFKPDARRYEAGSPNLLGLVALHEALRMVDELGVEAIAAELLRKRSWLIPALQARGFTVLQAEAPPTHASAIVSFYRPELEMAAVQQKLEERNIITSLRADRAGQRYLRVSPHYYNTDAELQRMLDLL